MLEKWLAELTLDPFFYPDDELPTFIDNADNAQLDETAVAFLRAYDNAEERREHLMAQAFKCVEMRVNGYRGLMYDEGQTKLFAFMREWFNTEAKLRGEAPFVCSDAAKLATISYISRRLYGATDADARAKLDNVGKSRPS